MLALALNVGLIVGGLHAIADQNIYELFASLVVSLIATVMKFLDCRIPHETAYSPARPLLW